MTNPIKIILLIITVFCVVGFGFSQSQILNLAYNESNGSIQAVAVGRGDLSPQSPTDHLSDSAILNLAYDSTNGAVQVILDNDSSGLFPETFSSNVANPPTDAQLDALFTSPAAKGDGWTCYIDDSDSDNFYQIVASGSLWMIFTAAKGL